MTNYARAISRLEQSVPGYSLALFRIFFGLVGFVSATRFIANGWVETLYLQPTHHFKYLGFSWVTVPPGWLLYALFAGLALISLAVMAGFLFRFAMPAFFVLFTYIELLDQTYYLNHYYFISLCSFLMCFLPMNRVWSMDARNADWNGCVPKWSIWVLRSQILVLYVFAGIAKLNADWLFEAEPEDAFCDFIETF